MRERKENLELLRRRRRWPAMRAIQGPFDGKISSGARMLSRLRSRSGKLADYNTYMGTQDSLGN